MHCAIVLIVYVRKYLNLNYWGKYGAWAVICSDLVLWYIAKIIQFYVKDDLMRIFNFFFFLNHEYSIHP